MPSEATTPRRPLPAALLLLSAAALGAVVAGYLVHGNALWLGNLSWTLGACVAVAGVAHAARHSEPAARAGWRLLLFACACWLLGQAWWDLYSLSAIPPSPNPGDLFWLLFAVLTAVGVLRLAQGAERGRTVSALELAPIIVAVCTLLVALLWDDVRASDLSVLGQITSLAYPALYVSAALLMIQAVVAGALDVSGNGGCAPSSSAS